MITMNTGKKPYRLEIGGAVRKSSSDSSRLHLVHANDQDSGDDFEGRRNWSFMLVLFAAFAGVSSSAAVWSLF
ncbi:hypothetical protein [Rhizobium terrae]|uniref:hypothetical protein n=1 Tax=Rhizobium terrae TaxID=2171756 RepID=UPI000E3BC6AF|nr:hypothetical protein [Rhizobium terrae]